MKAQSGVVLNSYGYQKLIISPVQLNTLCMIVSINFQSRAAHRNSIEQNLI